MRANPEPPKQVFVAGMFYMFLILTLIAFLLHLFGLNWFASTIKISEPSEIVQKITLAMLNTLELVFVYRILTKKSWMICFIISITQAVCVGFIPNHLYQSIANMCIMLLVTVILRKDRGYAILDFIFLFIIMNLYSAMLVLAKFGGLTEDYGHSFYANIASLLDYKLFIITIYTYIKYKGGFKIWKMKRKLLSQ